MNDLPIFQFDVNGRIVLIRDFDIKYAWKSLIKILGPEDLRGIIRPL